MISLGKIKLDPKTGHIFDQPGMSVPLRSQSAEVLKFLANRPNKVVSKAEIFDEVWADRTVTDDSLVQCVSDIRTALGEDAAAMIETIPRKGYRFNLPESEHSRFGRKWLAAVAVIAAAFAIMTSTWFFNEAVDVEPIAAVVDTDKPSILLLPFSVAPNQPEASLHAIGLQAELAGELGRHKDLRVIAPLFVPEEKLAGLAEETGANIVLTGALERRESQLRTTVNLRDANTTEILWSETWDVSTDDVFAVRDGILDQVATTLASTWTGGLAGDIRANARSRASTDISAYENFLIGSYFKHNFTLEGFEAARPYLQKAVEIDPNFARGWVALYLLDSLEGMKAPNRERRLELSERGRIDARKAMEIAPEDPWSLMAGSVLESDRGDPKAAGDMLKRAAELAPSNADLLAILAIAGAKHSNLTHEPAEWARRANELNPFPPPYYAHAMGFAAFAQEDYQTAFDVFKHDTLMPPNVLYALASAEKLGLQDEVKRLQKSFSDLGLEDVTANEVLHTQATGTVQTKFLVESARRAGLPVED